MPVPMSLSGSGKINENKLQAEYQQLVKKKDLEINSQMKSFIKDSMRISLKELGQIHYNNGFMQEANQQWIKSLDMSIADEDAFQM